ncbi:MAG TPA: SDR family oxidoreductase [Gemmatimonadales bacterium]|nr:SDR family oxidoreductase [Gemmatimonadales bacterium]
MTARRPLAVVTGASGGIGYELARLLAAADHDLVLVARSAGRLDAVATELGRSGGSVRPVAADLARPEGVSRLLDALPERGARVDVLVNNAGFGAAGPFAALELEAALEMIRLNVEALTHLTRAVLPGMLSRRRGRILNVASTAAFQPGPYMAVYYATKAYVLSFSEAIAEELRQSGVSVTALCPGPTLTGFQARAGIDAERLVRGRVAQDAASVARAGFEGMMAGRRVVVPGALNRIHAAGVRLLPRSFVTTLAALLNRGARRSP